MTYAIMVKCRRKKVYVYVITEMDHSCLRGKVDINFFRRKRRRKGERGENKKRDMLSRDQSMPMGIFRFGPI